MHKNRLDFYSSVASRTSEQLDLSLSVQQNYLYRQKRKALCRLTSYCEPALTVPIHIIHVRVQLYVGVLGAAIWEQ